MLAKIVWLVILNRTYFYDWWLIVNHWINFLVKSTDVFLFLAVFYTILYANANRFMLDFTILIAFFLPWQVVCQFTCKSCYCLCGTCNWNNCLCSMGLFASNEGHQKSYWCMLLLYLTTYSIFIFVWSPKNITIFCNVPCSTEETGNRALRT